MSRVEESIYTFDEAFAGAYQQAARGDIANQKWLNDRASDLKASLVATLSDLGVEADLMEVIKHIVSHWDDLSQREYFTDLITERCRQNRDATNDNLFSLARMSYYYQPANKHAVFAYLSQLNTYSGTTHDEGLKKEMAVLSKIGHELGSINATIYYVRLMADGIGMPPDLNASCDLSLAALKDCETGSGAANILIKHVQKLAAVDAESLKVIMTLSEIYRNGYGCIADRKLADECDRVAANLGSLIAFFRLYPKPLSIDELFELAQEDCHAAYKTIENLAQLVDDKDEAKRAKHVLALCKLHGYGTHQHLVTQPAAVEDLTDMKFKLVEDKDRRRYITSGYLDSRHKVGVFGGGYYFLQNQITLNLMLLGVHRKEYDVAPHCRATSSSMYDEIALKTLATYTNDYAKSLFGEARAEWQAIAQNLLDACQPPTVESVKQKLAAEKPVNTMAGWTKHAVSLTFFKVGDKFYLAYGNKGDAVYGNKPSIKFYQIHNPAKLLDQKWLTNLYKGKLTKAYMEMHDPTKEGLGKDLDLELVGIINCDRQNGDNCAVLSVSVSARVDLMHADFKQQYKKNPAGFALNTESVSACDDRIKMQKHKPWRFAMRRYAVSTLCDVGAKHKTSLLTQYHFDLIVKVIAGIHEKYPGRDEASDARRSVLLRDVQLYLKTKACQFNSTQIVDLTEYIQEMKEAYAPPAPPAKAKRSGLFARFHRPPAAATVVVDNPLIHMTRVTDNPLNRVGVPVAI
ncbi:MAG: hypothetical protein P1U34_09655 [Coxiellaceae bacterium]|nr:hypothetical protein [Coxiellaceae bacterium]